LVFAALASDAAVLMLSPQMIPLLRGATAMYLFVSMAVIWLLVSALQLATAGLGWEDANNQRSRSVLFHASVQLLRRCALLPIVATLLVALDGLHVRAATLLLLFVGSASVMGLQLQHTEAVPASLGLDFLLPPLYLGGMAFAQILLLAATLRSQWSVLPVWVAMLAPLWSFIYPRWIGSLGEPEWAPALREAAAIAPLMFWAWPEDVPGTLPLAAAVLTVLTLVRIIMGCRAAQSAMHEKAQAAGIFMIFEKLGYKGRALCRVGEFQGLAEEISSFVGRSAGAPALATALESFEAQVRIERLDRSFLRQRGVWLEDLRNGRGSFTAVANCALTLLAAVQVPPSDLWLTSRFKSSQNCTTRKVPSAVWAMILDFVGAAHPLNELLRPTVEFFSPGPPKKQLAWAIQRMHTCIQGKAELCKIRDVSHEAFRERLLFLVGKAEGEGHANCGRRVPEVAAELQRMVPEFTSSRSTFTRKA